MSATNPFKKGCALLCGAVACWLLAGCDGSGSGGALDAGFGTEGVATINFSGSDDKAYGVTLDASGSVYAVGSTQNATSDFAIVRLSPSGTPDSAFGADGRATADFAAGADTAYAVTAYPGGKVVAVGVAGSGGSARLALARWNADGSLDASFGTGGLVSHVIASGHAEFRAVALDGEKILVAGTAMQGGRLRFFLIRLTASGALDATFGTGGIVSETPGNISDQARAMVLTQTRIYVAGTSQVAGGTGNSGDFAVGAFNLNGALDTAFGTAGWRVFDFTVPLGGASGSALTDDTLYGMALSGNQLLLTGKALDSGVSGMAVARISLSGAVDSSFGTAGGSGIRVDYQESNGDRSTLEARAVAPSIAFGSIYLFGSALGLGASYFAVSRVNLAGEIVFGFGTNGARLLPVGDPNAECEAVVTQTNGRVILAGSRFLNNRWDFAVARFIP